MHLWNMPQINKEKRKDHNMQHNITHHPIFVLWVLSHVMNQLDLETLGFRPNMPNNLPEHCIQYAIRDPNNLPCTYG